MRSSRRCLMRCRCREEGKCEICLCSQRHMKVMLHRLDNDQPPHTQICVSDGDYAASQDSHVSPEDFIEFGLALQSFPQTGEHQAVFKSGSRESGWYCFIHLRAYERDIAGHAAFEVEMTNHAPGPSHRSAHFHIWCEAAALNRFGQSLEAWARSGRERFEFTDEIHEPEYL